MAGLIMGLADLRNPNSLASRMRRRRHQLFLEVVASIPKPISVLDVGGTVAFWSSLGESTGKDFDVTLMNLEPCLNEVPGFNFAEGDARDLREYRDGQFDMVFSNSVIEHVGDYADMQRMADEVRRVGRFYMVQTPNRYFPIEPHFHVPLFQFLPARLRAEMLMRRDLGWVKREPELEEALQIVNGVKLIGRSQMQAIFPDATIHMERFLGFGKSLIAVRRPG